MVTTSLVASPQKTSVLGIGVSRTTYPECTELIIESAKRREVCTVAAVNVHSITTAYRDPQGHGYRLKRFTLVAPDGQPVRWALNLLRQPGEQFLHDRVRGPELMLRLCERAASEGISIFLYGSKKSVLANLRTNLTKQFPNLKIAGTISPPFRVLSVEEDAEHMRQIRESGAGIVFVGLGCPRQERWIFEHRQKLNCPLVGVGAAFDMHSGNIQQAPFLMQKFGLEWLYRFLQDPIRLWKRYLLLNPLYVMLLTLQILKLLPQQNYDTPMESQNGGEMTRSARMEI
ncbi:MAG TPA: glycosyltransferase [Cyanobacteria bacterium UBA8803]|nr:glycosyltransferase [Cyanobacteria bacterium UBA9273]HBL62837.1 glycosyltransferase [Cyanobacteria bacterium UBA8803]